MKKPNVISEKEIPVRFISQVNYEMLDHRLSRLELFRIAKDEGLMQAQLDDTYEKMLAECESQIQPLKQQLETLRKQADIYYEQIQQAKAEVAREIFGEVKRIVHGTDEHGTHWVRTQREIEEDIESLKDRFLKDVKNGNR